MKFLKNKILIVSLLILVFSFGTAFISTPKVHASPSSQNPVSVFAIDCTKSKWGFFGLVPWYQYLKVVPDPVTGDFCSVQFNLAGNGGQFSAGGCSGADCNALGSILLVGLAVFEDLLRIAGLAAVGLIIYGGFRYMTSQGDPEATKGAQSTITNAIIGLIIAVLAATTISFIANKLGG